MWPYWLFFSLFLLNALIHIKPSLQSANLRKHLKGRYWSIEWVSIFILLVWIVGLRYEVGADWGVYLVALEEYGHLGDARDPGYDFLNWLAVIFDQEIVLVNFIAAIIFCYGLVIFCRNQALPALSMLVAFPYIVTVVAMGYTRQSIVLGLFMLGLVELENGNFWRYIGLIIFAALFHSSAVVLLPLAIVVMERYLFIKMLALVSFIVALYILMLDQVVDYVKNTYFTAIHVFGHLKSPATNIRLIMVLFPSLLLLLNIKRLKLLFSNINRNGTSIYVIRIWLVAALSSFAMIIPLVIFPSYTALDRLLLYWLPIQLFVFGNLPVTFLRANDLEERVFIYVYYLIYIMIIAYSCMVFAVWLFFGNNSEYWIPYSNYLWLLLWQR